MTPQEIFNFFAMERIKQLVNDKSMVMVRIEDRPTGLHGEMVPTSVEYLNYKKIIQQGFEFAQEATSFYELNFPEVI